MWMAAGDLHAVKLQLSGLFTELRDKMEEEMVKFSEINMKNNKQGTAELTIAKLINKFLLNVIYKNMFICMIDMI